MGNYQELTAWRSGMDLADAVHEAVLSFPTGPYYKLMDQMIAAAASIPSNLAEGTSRSSDRDFTRFVEYARGSLFELETQLLLAKRMGLVSEYTARALLARTASLSRGLAKLLGALRR